MQSRSLKRVIYQAEESVDSVATNMTSAYTITASTRGKLLTRSEPSSDKALHNIASLVADGYIIEAIQDENRRHLLIRDLRKRSGKPVNGKKGG